MTDDGPVVINKDTTYEQIWQWYHARHRHNNMAEADLWAIHIKWKKIASEVR